MDTPHPALRATFSHKEGFAQRGERALEVRRGLFLLSARCSERHFAHFTPVVLRFFSNGDGLWALRGQGAGRATQIVGATGQHDVRLVAREVEEAHPPETIVLLEHGVRSLHG